MWGPEVNEEDDYEDSYHGCLTKSGVWVDDQMRLLEPENNARVLFWCPVTKPKKDKG